ncbi:MAG: hypothetical protein EOM50_24300 [Erysipelotrichia bacterium]|nr:hypothetical protein [Erysipelotrichia bacterium]
MLGFKFHVFRMYLKVNVHRLREFAIRNTLVAVIFLIQWILGNLVWYAFAFIPMGLPKFFVRFARGYIGFLYSPAAAEKAFYYIFAVFLARRIRKAQKRFKFEPKWQKAYKRITLLSKI